MNNTDIHQLNQSFRHLSAEEIVASVCHIAENPIVSTSFGPNSAVLLHMVTQKLPNIPVVWVDSGYNTNPTYKFALELIERLRLNIKIYTPKSTSSFLNVKMCGIPDIGTPAHREFTETIKIEPFNRALSELRPDIWLSGIRAEETQFRKTLEIFSGTSSNLVKVAPLLNWSSVDTDRYIEEYGLPTESHYFDPTKLFEGRECGLHTRI